MTHYEFTGNGYQSLEKQTNLEMLCIQLQKGDQTLGKQTLMEMLAILSQNHQEFTSKGLPRIENQMILEKSGFYS